VIESVKESGPSQRLTVKSCWRGPARTLVDGGTVVAKKTATTKKVAKVAKKAAPKAAKKVAKKATKKAATKKPAMKGDCGCSCK
jgi:hypothetical protein